MRRKGKSYSRRPVSKRKPSWCKYSPEEVEAFIINLAKDGVPQSKIGVILRDQYGIPLVKSITGKSISETLKDGDMSPSIPEDLNNLMNKANRLSLHLSKNKKDSVNKHSLELGISKIRRLAKYYRNKHVLSEKWKYVTPTIAE